MAWASYYFEFGGNEGKFLRESGFKRFPAVCPRWGVVGGDIYGTGPGMDALGDIRQLQHQQLRKAQAIDYQVNPPLAVPTSLKNRDMDRLPGGVTYVDQTGQNQPVKSMFDVQLEMQYLLQDMQEVRQRINSTFYADLFLMISNSEDPNMTATEVAARQEEKMLMLGPVFERLSNELFAPLINITFDALVDAGGLPPPPQQMQGMPLSVEYLSVLAQAQRAINTNSTDRFVSSMTAVAQVKPDVLDKFDSDAWADSYSEEIGLDPNIILPNDQVQQMRQQRAQAQAAQQQAALQQQQSQTVKNLGQTQTGGPPNAATDMLSQLTGYGSPQQ
jgi:hypothetical protein